MILAVKRIWERAFKLPSSVHYSVYQPYTNMEEGKKLVKKDLYLLSGRVWLD